jgi:hypothetical protein
VVSPAGKRVRDRLAQQPELQRMLVMNANTRKRAYNERVFLRDFHTVKAAAGIADLQFRHLRHTFVVEAKRARPRQPRHSVQDRTQRKVVDDMLRSITCPMTARWRRTPPPSWKPTARRSPRPNNRIQNGR